MTIVTINTSEDHSQYIAQIYQEHYARLRHYFRTQLGDKPDADACVHETIRRFFFFMEDRCWEADVEYFAVYLMRIAGLLCSRKLAEKMAQSTNGDERQNNGVFDGIKTTTHEIIKQRIDFKGFLLSPAEAGSRRHSAA